MSAHTPGPWFLLGDGSQLEIDIRTDPRPDAVCETVATAWGGGSVPLNINARLIAAAPELLAALKDLRAMVIGEHGASAYENVNGERADAVIAKAEGRS